MENSVYLHLFPSTSKKQKMEISRIRDRSSWISSAIGCYFCVTFATLMGNVTIISHDKKLDDWQDILQYNAVAGYCRQIALSTFLHVSLSAKLTRTCCLFITTEFSGSFHWQEIRRINQVPDESRHEKTLVFAYAKKQRRRPACESVRSNHRLC